jgi:hypothetical protein
MEEQPDEKRTVRPRLRAWLLLSPVLVLGLLVGSCGAALAVPPEAYPGDHKAGLVGLAIGATVLASVLLPLVNPLLQVRSGVLIKRNVFRVQKRWPVDEVRWVQLNASHLDAFLPDGTRAFRLSLHWWRKARVERLAGSQPALEGAAFPITPAMASGVTLAADQAPSQGMTVRALPITPEEARALRNNLGRPRIAIALAALGAVSLVVAAIVQERVLQLSAGGLAGSALLLAAAAAWEWLWRWQRLERDLSAELTIQATGTLELIDGERSWTTFMFSEERQRTCKLIVKGVEIGIPEDVADAIERHAIRTKKGFLRTYWRFNGTVEYLPRSRVALRVMSSAGRLVHRHPAFARTRS